MAKITFIKLDGSAVTVEANNGLSLMEVALKNGMEKIEGSCGGSLACATCHLYVHPDWWTKTMPVDGEISDEENDMLDLAFHLTKRSRLSCQIIISDALDGLVVALPGAKVDWAK